MAQIQKVLFSYHAAQRLNERFNSEVTTRNEVDISSTFMKAGAPYQHHNGDMVQCYVPRDLSMRMAMIIAIQSRVVLTVLNDGALLDAIYRKITH